MRTKYYLVTLIVFCSVIKSFAQLSVYNSLSYGYFKNPLYNYQELSDQLKQTYTEIGYTKQFTMSRLNFNYVSGLVAFNRFEDRNYYEHNLSSSYSVAFNENESDEDYDQKDFEDSTDKYLDFTLKVGGRHDKEIFKDFNNFGANLYSSYRFMINDDYFLQISNSFGFRDYSNITVLSNITDVLSFQIGNTLNQSFNYGLNVSGGFKYYTESIYDTSKFEASRSFTTKSSGKGKTGANVTVPSEKSILTTPQSNGTTQFTADIFMKTYWGTNSLQANFLYRYNPNTLVRYLAQYANTTFLTEDIYNDYFSYEGFEVQTRLIQKIFYDIEIRLDVAFQQKKFGAPALALIGTQVADQRLDLRTFTEAYISKYFNLSDNLGLGLALSSGFVRNQSNDAYNDFSSFYLSFSVGLGFYTEF